MTSSSVSPEDICWMRLALKLARKGLGSTSPNPMVGAVIVRSGRLLGSGWHVRAGEAHAEVNAFRSLGKEESPRGATLYVTLEPCSSWGRTPPCTEAVLSSGVSRVVIGSLDPNPKHAGRAVRLLREKGLDVLWGVEKEACDQRNEAFFKWIVKRQPFVLLKLAETLDGKIATAGGVSRWITSSRARRRVQELRRWADAVLCGAETFRADSPSFTVRTEKAGRILKTPRRIVVSRHPERLELPGESVGGGAWEAIDLSGGRAAWEEFLTRLGSENVTSLLIEGGGGIAASALRAGAVDKVEFHIAPRILGGCGSRPSVGGENPESLEEAFSLEHTAMRKLGVDWMLTGYLPGRRLESPCLQD